MTLERIGKYEIVARVGKGAMGEVYRAKDPVLNRFVAIKIISSNLVSDEQFRLRFLQEARSAAQLNHRNIVTVFEFNEQAGQVFLVMEFLEGSDLREAIGRRALTRLEDQLGVIEQVCDGLVYAHSKGIVHRDLKPANIRLLPNLTPKIMDFGLARLGTSDITRAGTVMGTPDYMSPEQVRAEKVDARSDLFSVGAVLYHLLSGKKPFEADSVHSILFEVLEREPEPLRRIVPDLPPVVLPIVDRALRKDPTQRFQNATQLRDALRDARRAIAAGRAAASVMVPESSTAEVTLTRIDLSPVSYPSMSTGGPGSVSRRGAPPAEASASPPTISVSGASIGATALDVTPSLEGSVASTERPESTLMETVLEPASGSRGPLLIAAVAVIALLAGAFVAWTTLRPAGPAPEAAREREVMLREALIAEQVDLAQSELANKDYAAARAKAEAALVLEPGNTKALDVVAKAGEAVATLEAAAKAARAAFDRGDTDAATRALSEVLALDPRHEVARELSSALNQHFRKQAEDARRQAEKARRAAEGAKASAQAGFQVADRLVGEAAGLVENGQFVDAARRFAEAGDGYDRARRAAEAAAAAAVAAAAAAARPTPGVVAPVPVPPTVERVPPSVATAVPPPPPAVAPTLPIAPAASALPPSGPPAPAAEPAVRRIIADYGRALEAQDLNLFKTIYPGLSSDDEKRLRESFRAIKTHQVGLRIESLQIEGARATIRVSRQDTLNGQQMKPRQQTFKLVQRGATWTIESIGQ